MAISSTDVKIKHSEKTGPGNTNAGNGDGSLGGFISTTEIPSAQLHNLFDVVTGDENQALEDEFRCVFVHNAHATDTFFNIRIYILSEVAGGANAAIGIDPTAASAVGSASAQAVNIANENTAPVGVSFFSPTTLETAINLGDLLAGQCRAFWVRRRTTDSAALANDGVTLRIQGESI